MFVVTISLVGGHTFALGYKSEAKAEKLKNNLEKVFVGQINDTALNVVDESGKSITFRPDDLVAVGLNRPKADASGVVIVPAVMNATGYVAGGKI